MGSRLRDVQVKVQNYISQELDNITVDSDGVIEFLFGSTKATIKVVEEMGDVVVEVFSPVIFEPKKKDGLLEALNRLNLIGPVTWGYIDSGPTDAVIAKYTVLGEYLDLDELRYAINLVINAADSVDESLAKDFQAKRYFDLFN